MITTIYINRENMNKLNKASSETGISLNILVKKILQRINKRRNRPPSFLSPVKYQQKLEKSQWTRLHLNISSQLYEKCLDIRKLFKASVSRLFAEEIAESIEIIIRELLSGKTEDNYSDTYFIFYEKDQNGHNYRVYNTVEAMLRDSKT